MPRLPTIHTYPGLELAGYDDAPLGGPLDILKNEASTYMKAAFEREILPRIKVEAMKGAEEAVKPLVIAAMVLSGVSIVISLTALLRSPKRGG